MIPNTSISTGEPASKTGKGLAIVGTLLQVCILLGLYGAIDGIFNGLSILKVPGVIGPELVSKAITEVLISTFIGMAGAYAGCALLILAVTVFRYRAEWLFGLFMVLGVLHLVVPPVGTLFGLFFLVFGLVKKDEFLNRPSVIRTQSM